MLRPTVDHSADGPDGQICLYFRDGVHYDSALTWLKGRKEVVQRAAGGGDKQDTLSSAATTRLAAELEECRSALLRAHDENRELVAEAERSKAVAGELSQAQDALQVTVQGVGGLAVQYDEVCEELRAQLATTQRKAVEAEDEVAELRLLRRSVTMKGAGEYGRTLSILGDLVDAVIGGASSVDIIARCQAHLGVQPDRSVSLDNFGDWNKLQARIEKHLVDSSDKNQRMKSSQVNENKRGAGGAIKTQGSFFRKSKEDTLHSHLADELGIDTPEGRMELAQLRVMLATGSPLEMKKHTNSLNTEVNKLRDEVRCRKTRHERKREPREPRERENRDRTCMVILTRVGPTFKDCRILSLCKTYSMYQTPDIPF